MIDHDRKLLFVHIARTGGTSVETALAGKDWWQIEPESKHISASQARNLYGEEVWRSYTKFSIVRNPWDRLVSMWATGWWKDEAQKRGANPTTLQEFILTLEPHPHERYASLHYHSILDQNLDFILRFEDLQDDFSAMLSSIEVPDIRLPHVESRDRGHYRTYFDEESASLVATMFQRDIQKFGYSY